MRRLILPAFLASLATFTLAHAGISTFDSSADGWGVFGGNDGSEGDFLRTTGGNPGGHIEFIAGDMFGVNFHNDSKPDLIGDYSRYSNGLKLSVDVKAESIFFFSTEVPRNMIVELIDNNPPGSDYPYVSVWYNLGEVSSAQGAFQHFEVTIANPTATALPAGWGGYGAETQFGEPILPADRTFASVLASVDELRFTTIEPGFFYGLTFFDMRYDNAGLTAVPEPTALGAIGAATLFALRRRRA